jgi:hypothetical protein
MPCKTIVGGTLGILADGVNIRATGDWTLRLNTVVRTPVEDGACPGAVTEVEVSPGLSGQIIDCGDFKMSDFQKLCNVPITVQEPSGKIWIFKGATFIETLEKSLNDGRVTVNFTALSYVEQLPSADARISIAA